MKRIVNVRAVECPYCRAPRGVGCVNQADIGKPLKHPHAERRTAAIRFEDANRWNRVRPAINEGDGSAATTRGGGT